MFDTTEPPAVTETTTVTTTTTRTTKRAELACESCESERHWYGWQTLIADGISLVTAPILVGIGSYVLAPPIIHLVHEQYLSAGLSLLTRVGAPFAGAAFAVGVMCNDHGGDFPCFGEAIGGFAVGIITAIALDASVYSWEPNQKKRVAIIPALVPRDGGGQLVVGATF